MGKNQQNDLKSENDKEDNDIEESEGLIPAWMKKIEDKVENLTTMISTGLQKPVDKPVENPTTPALDLTPLQATLNQILEVVKPKEVEVDLKAVLPQPETETPAQPVKKRFLSRKQR